MIIIRNLYIYSAFVNLKFGKLVLKIKKAR
jgi:hypothetical protein